jgi:hypothetical protein
MGRSLKNVISEVTVGVPDEEMDLGRPDASRVLQSNSMVVKLNAGEKVPSPQPFSGLTLQK